jgi:tetratricopeptide (TPR) repeat protein
MAVSLNGLALGLKDGGAFAEARRLLEEARGLWLEVGDGAMHARTLSNISAIAHEQGDLEAAQALHQESLELFRQLGDRQGVAWSLRHQGDVARSRGDTPGAATLYAESLAAFEELGDPWSAGGVLTELGHLALGANDGTAALERFTEAATMLRQHGGHKRGLARVLEGLAIASSLDDDHARAITLAGAAAALRNAIGAPLTPSEQKQVSASLERSHATLSAAERTRAWSEGWAMTPDQALEFALGE